MGKLPIRKNIDEADVLSVEVDLAALRSEEEGRLDEMLLTSDWDALLSNYPIRESRAFDKVIEKLRLRDQAVYRATVLKLLMDDPEALQDLRDLFGGLYAEVSA